MSIILPEDTIPASGEITGSPRLGLPKIPRANNNALAALNAITRLLDGSVAKRDGEVHTGTHTFTQISTTGIVSTSVVTTNLQSANGTVGNLQSTSATIQNATLNQLSAVNGTIQNLTATNTTSGTTVTQLVVAQNVTTQNATVANTLIADKLVAPSGEIAELGSNVGNIKNLTSENVIAQKITAGEGIFTSIKINNVPGLGTEVRIGQVVPNYASSTPHAHIAAVDINPDVINYSLSIPHNGWVSNGTVHTKNKAARYTILQTGTASTPIYEQTGLGFPLVSGERLFEVDYLNKEIKVTGGSSIDYAHAKPFLFTFEAIRYGV